MQIVQIVPRLPPSIDGVGDYAYLLAKQLRAVHGIHTVFVVCDTKWKSEVRSQKSEVRISEVGNQKSEIELDGFKVFQLKERSATELLRVLSQPEMPGTVLLQYVGYGYQKRGCPGWLVRGLEKWRKQKVESGNESAEVRSQKSAPTSDLRSPTSSLSAGRRLVTMFHEISASGPVWSSAFWTAPVQKRIAKSLARLSSHCFTNLKLHANTLQKFTAGKASDVTVLPVFSNMGEPEQLPDWKERQPRMIVFGSASQRRKVYLECRADLEQACQAMGLNEIVDIGAAVEIPQLSVRVSQRGVLSAHAISREMLAARAGFFAYPSNCLGKSGIFAAYAVHGLVPVTFEKNGMENLDGLILGEHFISANTLQGHDADHLENIGKNAFEWHGGHSTQKQATAFAEKLYAFCRKN